MMMKPLYLILILLQTEDMVKDQLEINLTGKKLVLRIVSYYNTFTSLFNIIITDKIPDWSYRIYE